MTICYDADARTNPNVLRAMIRFGRWLKSKGVKKVWYLIVPAEINGVDVKGADDFLAAGGTLEQLKAARATTAPNPDIADDTISDARLAETIADEVLADQFMWISGLGWMTWDGRRWATATEVEVTEAVRQVIDPFAEVVDALRNGQGSKKAADGWRSMLGAGRMRSVLGLARGIVARKADELDADLDSLNTPSGIVDLRTGELLAPERTLLMTKITSGNYRPGCTHPDWEKPSKRYHNPSGNGSSKQRGPMTNQGVKFHLPPGGQFSAAVDRGLGVRGRPRTVRAVADRDQRQ